MKYESPELEIMRFEIEDIVTNSDPVANRNNDETFIVPISK